VGHNAFFYLWIISAVISTGYTFTWDIKMDWGLLDKNAGENKLLREEIVYPHKVRLSYSFHVTPGGSGGIRGEGYLWNVYRGGGSITEDFL